MVGVGHIELGRNDSNNTVITVPIVGAYRLCASHSIDSPAHKGNHRAS